MVPNFTPSQTIPQWRAGVTLWLKSFHQVPAASLPDDDVALARLAELGATSGHGVVSNGTHSADGCAAVMADSIIAVVAEKALEAWIEKLGQRKSSGIGNAKRWGAEFDLAALDQELDESVRRLNVLNPNSRAFARRFVKEHIARTNPLKDQGANCPDGSAAGVPGGSQEKGRDR